MPCWRQRDAYSREENSGSQLDVLPRCYDGGVTGVTDAIQQQILCSTQKPMWERDRLAGDGVLTVNIFGEC